MTSSSLIIEPTGKLAKGFVFAFSISFSFRIFSENTAKQASKHVACPLCDNDDDDDDEADGEGPLLWSVLL